MQGDYGSRSGTSFRGGRGVSPSGSQWGRPFPTWVMIAQEENADFKEYLWKRHLGEMILYEIEDEASNIWTSLRRNLRTLANETNPHAVFFRFVICLAPNLSGKLGTGATIFAFTRSEKKKRDGENEFHLSLNRSFRRSTNANSSLLDWFGWPGSCYSSNWQSAAHNSGDTFSTNGGSVGEWEPAFARVVIILYVGHLRGFLQIHNIVQRKKKFYSASGFMSVLCLSNSRSHLLETCLDVCITSTTHCGR